MFLRKLSDKLPANTVCVADVGQNQMLVLQQLCNQGGRTFSYHRRHGNHGLLSSLRVGAKMAAPDREVVVVCGDGSFQMQMMELATIMQEGIAVKIIIMRNNRLGMVESFRPRTMKIIR